MTSYVSTFRDWHLGLSLLRANSDVVDDYCSRSQFVDYSTDVICWFCCFDDGAFHDGFQPFVANFSDLELFCCPGMLARRSDKIRPWVNAQMSLRATVLENDTVAIDLSLFSWLARTALCTS